MPSRCLSAWRWLVCCAMAACLALPAAEAANTSRPTGRGAVHDNSVYCQNWPGQPSRGPYRGTGPQNPFGADCRPGPNAEPPRAEPADACSMRRAALASGVVLVANQQAGGLWLEGRRIRTAGEVGASTRPGRPLAGTRLEILEAMRCSEHRRFAFGDRARLLDTIELRAQIVERMEARRSGALNSAFGCALSPPRGWETYEERRSTMTVDRVGRAARSTQGLKASDAIQRFRTQPSMLDCHLGMQMTLLDAAAETLGTARFDALHPLRAWPHLVAVGADGRPARHALVGVGVPVFEPVLDVLGSQPIALRYESLADFTSVAQHLAIVRFIEPTGAFNQGKLEAPIVDERVGDIEPADMVPGDWAFLQNLPDYRQLAPGGAFAGENAFYVGRPAPGERYLTPKDDDDRPFEVVAATTHEPPALFFGFGLEGLGYDVSEAALRKYMARDYNGYRRGTVALPNHMVWTRLGAPTLDSSQPAEAGPFVR